MTDITIRLARRALRDEQTRQAAAGRAVYRATAYDDLLALIHGYVDGAGRWTVERPETVRGQEGGRP